MQPHHHTFFLKADNIKQPKFESACPTSFRHNPRNNTFTSVYEAPINMKAKMQNQASGEVSPRHRAPRPGTPAACHCSERSGYRHKQLLSCLDTQREVMSKVMVKFDPFETVFY